MIYKSVVAPRTSDKLSVWIISFLLGHQEPIIPDLYLEIHIPANIENLLDLDNSPVGPDSANTCINT